MSRTTDLPRRTIGALVLTFALVVSGCGGDDDADEATAETTAPSDDAAASESTPATAPPGTEQPADDASTDDGASTGDGECFGIGASTLLDVVDDRAVTFGDVLQPRQDPSRGVVVCELQFSAVPGAEVGDATGYFGVTMTDSSRYVDATGSPVTLAFYEAISPDAITLDIGDGAVGWGAESDSDIRHYRYVAFAQGDFVAMVYAGIEPFETPDDWAPVDSLLEEWVTLLAGHVADAAIDPADLPVQEEIVAITTAAVG